MAEPPDIDELTKRYLDLWQEHLSGMAADPEWVAAMTRVFTACAAPTSAGGPLPMNLDAFNAWLGKSTGGDAQPAERSAAAAGASDDGGADVSELQRRIAALEQRIAALEQQDGGC